LLLKKQTKPENFNNFSAQMGGGEMLDALRSSPPIPEKPGLYILHIKMGVIYK